MPDRHTRRNAQNTGYNRSVLSYTSSHQSQPYLLPISMNLMNPFTSLSVTVSFQFAAILVAVSNGSSMSSNDSLVSLNAHPGCCLTLKIRSTQSYPFHLYMTFSKNSSSWSSYVIIATTFSTKLFCFSVIISPPCFQIRRFL